MPTHEERQRHVDESRASPRARGVEFDADRQALEDHYIEGRINIKEVCRRRAAGARSTMPYLITTAQPPGWPMTSAPRLGPGTFFIPAPWAQAAGKKPH